MLQKIYMLRRICANVNSKRTCTGLVCIVVLSMMMVNLQGVCGQAPGWSEDVQFTFSGDNGKPSIAVSGSNVHVAWVNYTSEYDIFYRKSEDFGFTWTEEKILTNPERVYPTNPRLAVNGDIIHAVFEDIRISSTFEIYYLRSIDNGETWTEEVRISEFTGDFSVNPDISVDGDNVYVVFADERVGGFVGYREIYFKRSSDGGITWGDDMRLTYHQIGTSDVPSIIATPTKLHLVYSQSTGGDPSAMEVMYMNSSDQGDTWSTPVMLSADDDRHSIFSGPNGFAVVDDTVHVVWQDQRHFNDGELYYRRSIDAGASWGPEIRLLERPDDGQRGPRVTAENDIVHVFWADSRNNGMYYFDIYSMNSTDGGGTWNSDYRVTYEPWPVNTGPNTVKIHNGYTHLVFMDNRTGDDQRELYYKRSPDFGEPIPEFGNIVVPVVATMLMVTVATSVRRRKKNI